jgi:FkbM family methyltransferase
MKKLLIQLLKPIVVPFKPGTKNYYRIRDIFYTNSAEHLHKVKDYVQKIETDLSQYEQVLDIGAANGDTALFFSQSFPTQKIIAFEPNPLLRGIASEKVSKHENIELKDFALGNKNGQVVLKITEDPLSSSILEPDQSVDSRLSTAKEIHVSQKRLDDLNLFEQKTLLIKLDTQGTELEIMKGGEKTFKNTRFVLCEMMNNASYKNSCQYFEIDKFLRYKGYKLLDIITTFRSPKGLAEFDAIYLNSAI